MLKRCLGRCAELLRDSVDVRRTLLYVALAPLIVVLVHRPVAGISSRATPVAELSGKNWRYDLNFPVRNLSIVEQLIECESQGQNISRIDSNGQVSQGILQFNGTSTWNEMEQRFDFYGDPRNPSAAIHMADMMISSGLVGRWTCARSLGLTK